MAFDSKKETETIIFRLRARARIRRLIKEGKPDRIADLLDEAADELEKLMQ